MKQYGFKRILALLLACLMTMGCFAYATEETEAAAQEQIIEVEETLNDDAADEPNEQLPDDAESEETEGIQQGEGDVDSSSEAIPDDGEGQVAAEDEAVVEDTAVASNDGCAHALTESYQYMREAEYTFVDDKYHESFGYLVTVVYCDICGKTLSEVAATEKSTRQDRHDFSREEGTCYECGAVNTCTHKSTYMDEYWQDVEYTPIDEKTHERRGHRVTRIWCEDCEMTLSEEVSPEISSEIERHWFEDGACEVCG